MKNMADSRSQEKKQIPSMHIRAFHLASVSKTFTAMAILKLWEEGKLDIHDDMSKYLAGFPIRVSLSRICLASAAA